MKPLLIVACVIPPVYEGNSRLNTHDAVYRGCGLSKEKTSATVQQVAEAFQAELDLAPSGSIVSEYDQLKKRLEAFKRANDQLQEKNSTLEQELKQLQSRVYSLTSQVLEENSRRSERTVPTTDSASQTESEVETGSHSSWLLDISKLTGCQPVPCIINIADSVKDQPHRLSGVVVLPNTPLKKEYNR